MLRKQYPGTFRCRTFGATDCLGFPTPQPLGKMTKAEKGRARASPVGNTASLCCRRGALDALRSVLQVTRGERRTPASAEQLLQVIQVLTLNGLHAELGGRPAGDGHQTCQLPACGLMLSHVSLVLETGVDMP